MDYRLPSGEQEPRPARRTRADVQTPRSPKLYRVLRAFVLSAFFELGLELENGADVPVVLEEHASPNRPTLYEYRPLLSAFVESRAEQLGRRQDALDALEALKDEPATGIFARAHVGERVGEDEALRRTVLLPLLVQVVEACGAFDWEDGAFDCAYAELERVIFGERRHYRVLVPLVGLTAGGPIELGRSLRVREAAVGELSASWPDAARLLPRDFGREWAQTLVLELERELEGSACAVPDAPLEVGHAVSALRLAVPGAIAAGPVLFEWLDWRPYGVRPVPPLASQIPPGEPTRLDPFRAPLAGTILERLAGGSVDPDLLEALERWELALFHTGPQRADELREALEALLGEDEGPWAAAMRAAVLLGESARERGELARGLRGLLDGDGPGAHAEDAIRRALVEAMLSGSRAELVAALDEALLGLRPRPQMTIGARLVAAG